MAHFKIVYGYQAPKLQSYTEGDTSGQAGANTLKDLHLLVICFFIESCYLSKAQLMVLFICKAF